MNVGRSQSLHGTEVARGHEKRRVSKAMPREGRQEGGSVSDTGQSESEAPGVLKGYTRRTNA